MFESKLIKSPVLILRDIPKLELTRPLFVTKTQTDTTWVPAKYEPKAYKGFYRNLITFVSNMKPMPEYNSSAQKVWEEYVMRLAHALRGFAAADLDSKVELYDTDDDMFGYTVDFYQFVMPSKDYRFLVEFSSSISVESSLGPVRRYIVDKLPKLWRSRLSNKFGARRTTHMKVWVDKDNYMDFELYSERIPVDKCGLGFIVENAKWSGVAPFWKNYGLESYDRKQYDLRTRFFGIAKGNARVDDKRQFPRSVVERVRRPRKDDAS